MISYETEINVKLYNKYIGTIKQVEGGFQYFPQGHNIPGNLYTTLDKCKQSLDNCDD